MSQTLARGFDSQHFSDEKIIYVAEVNQRCWLEESGQWLENVDQTHLVLASGKPVLQQNFNKKTHVQLNFEPQSAFTKVAMSA